MCLVVYLGTDVPLGLPSPPTEDAAVGIREADVHPKALANKRYAYEIVDRFNNTWCCSCVFLDFMPWETEPGDGPEELETERREAAYDTLRGLACLAFEADPVPLLFSCWNGDEGDEAVEIRKIVPSELRPQQFLFQDDKWDHVPTLFKLRPDTWADREERP